jgi:hypothetical protein
LVAESSVEDLSRASDARIDNGNVDRVGREPGRDVGQDDRGLADVLRRDRVVDPQISQMTQILFGEVVGDVGVVMTHMPTRTWAWHPGVVLTHMPTRTWAWHPGRFRNPAL